MIGRVIFLLVVLGLAAAFWDFRSFTQRAERVLAAGPPSSGEAVAVLTGASDARIVAGVRLGQARGLPVLISGVHVDTTEADIARIVEVDPQEIACCVSLGRAAASTAGNGAEVAEWARRFEMRRVIVVTSEYHMDRALIELHRAMPEAELLPYAVSTTRVRPSAWLSDAPTARLLIEEWTKYRIAAFRRGAPEERAAGGPSVAPADRSA